MKRILFVLLLIGTSFVSIAQETFVNKYTSYVTNIKDVISEMKATEVTIVFNEGNTTDIVVYAKSGAKRFYRTGEVRKGKTNGGYEYQWVDCIQEETGYKASIQLFDDACRIFFDADYVEYQK